MILLFFLLLLPACTGERADVSCTWSKVDIPGLIDFEARSFASVVGSIVVESTRLTLPECTDPVVQVAEARDASFSVTYSDSLLNVYVTPSDAGWAWARIRFFLGDDSQDVYARVHLVEADGIRISDTTISEPLSLTIENCGYFDASVVGLDYTDVELTEESEEFPVLLEGGATSELMFATPPATFDTVGRFTSTPPVPRFRATSLPCPDEDRDGDGFTACTGDCNEEVSTIHPGAAEALPYIDDDCDGMIDFTGGCTAWLAALDATDDRDRDGYTLAEGDCDDMAGWANPGLPEMCGDSVDNDCNDEVDDVCD